MSKAEKYHRQDWFINRIGKRIYRHTKKKCCMVCDTVYEYGLIIYSRFHAEWLYVCQNEEGLIYSDKKLKNYGTKKV